MNQAKEAGDRGEAAAARYLQSRGCEILDRQWRCRYGELDLVSRTGDGILCFVEVKLRSTRSSVRPREFVDARKRTRLRRTAAMYLSLHGLEDLPARFDVAEVYLDEAGRICRMEYMESAFE